MECESLNTDKFTVWIRALVGAGREIFACGTCLKTRQSEGSELCSLSTLQDLYNIAKFATGF